MSYFTLPLIALPVAVVLASAVLMISRMARGKGVPRPPAHHQVALFLLVAWSVVFIYITQFLSFGDGIGAGSNFVPLVDVITAWQYGLVNAPFVEQLLLNVIVTLPGGVLLPLVWRRAARLVVVGATGFGIAVLTELVQLATGRACDIDDVICNTYGFVAGAALLRAFSASVSGVRARVSPPVSKFVPAVVTVGALVGVCGALPVHDAATPYGHIYYGQIRPSEIWLSHGAEGLDVPSERAVYRVEPASFTDGRRSHVERLLGGVFNCSLSDGDDVCLNRDTQESYILFKEGGWGVYFSPADEALTTIGDDEAMAKEALTNSGVENTDDLLFLGKDEDYDDGLAHLVFQSTDTTSARISWGQVRVAVTTGGAIGSIEDTRVEAEAGASAAVEVPERAIRVTKEVGLAPVASAKAYVDSLTPSLYLNSDSGYLIPSWQAAGRIEFPDGQSQPWVPNVDARKR